MVALLAITITTGTTVAAAIANPLPDIRGVTLWLVQQNSASPAKPSIAKLKARQEVRKRINKQLLILKKMQIDQMQLQSQQRKLMEQSLRRQTIRSNQRRTEARQAISREAEKRAILENARRSNQNLTLQRNEQPKTVLNNQRKMQEQSIKEKYPALQSYYRSLSRSTLRAQNDRNLSSETTSRP